MGIKEFIKPTIGKIVLFVLLMVGITFYLIMTNIIYDTMILVGFPLNFYPVGSVRILPDGSPLTQIVEFSYLNFILNLIFWYLISCLIVYTYNKIRKI
jgi:hypothetical protein